MAGLALIWFALVLSASVGSQTATMLALVAALAGGIPLDSPLLWPFVIGCAFMSKVVTWLRSQFG